MAWHKGQVRSRCYPSGDSAAKRIIGIVLIIVGAVLILFCVPYWAWLAALGAALVILGLFLIRRKEG